MVRVNNKRHGLSVISTVTNKGQMRWRIFDGALNTNILIDFLRRLIKGARKKLFLILDNLNVHMAKAVREWLDEHPDHIAVFYLPPYSPELKPSEYFNGDLKGAIQRGIPPKDVEELKRTMLSHSRRIQKSPARVRAYFKNRHIRYAA